MITGVRSALLCDKIDRTPEGLTNYLGIHGVQLLADTAPGLLEMWLSLHVDVDKRRSAGHVQVAAADIDLRVPFDMTTDRGLAVIAFPLFVPVQAPDTLTVTLTDTGRRDKPFRFKWSLGFAPGAKALEPAVAQTVLEEAAQANREVLASLAKPPVKH
jgi:hypothetical protein